MGEGDEQHDCDAIKQPFLISRYPVTVAQFQAFLDADKKRAKPDDYDPVFQTPNHPRVGVSWYEASAFCAWLSEQLKLTVTLPSEAEWERAARHTDGREYPWGNETGDVEQRCNVEATGIGHTSAVGMFPLGHEKGFPADMAGNVWEWMRSLWGKEYHPYRAEDGREDLDAGRNVARVLRGGSWNYHVDDARCASPGWIVPDGCLNFVGFRVVASPFSKL